MLSHGQQDLVCAVGARRDHAQAGVLQGDLGDPIVILTFCTQIKTLSGFLCDRATHHAMSHSSHGSLGRGGGGGGDDRLPTSSSSSVNDIGSERTPLLLPPPSSATASLSGSAAAAATAANNHVHHRGGTGTGSSKSAGELAAAQPNGLGSYQALNLSTTGMTEHDAWEHAGKGTVWRVNALDEKVRACVCV